MSYSQYWYRSIEISEATFGLIVKDIEKLALICKKKGIKIDVEPDIINIEGVLFPRVIPEEWKKIFVMFNDGRIFQFCNSNGNWFEIAIKAFLIVAKHHLKDKITVVGEGYNDFYRWEDAIKLVKETLGYGESFKLEESPSFEDANIKITLHQYKN